MEITVQIDDKNFESFFGDIKNSFTNDMKKEIFKKGLDNWINSEEVQTQIKDMMIQKDYYNNYKPKLTQAAENLFKEALLSDKEYVEEIKNVLVDIFKENGKEILVESLAKIMLRTLADSKEFADSIRFNSEVIINDAISNHRYNDHNIPLY